MGTGRTPYAVSGEIRTKFKFNNVENEEDLSVPGTKVVLKPLPPNVGAEANADGNIYLNENIDPSSFMARKIVMHEMKHATDMRIGKLAYEDDHIMHDGYEYPRQTINGMDMIQFEGKWVEAGDESLPWENEANGFQMSVKYVIIGTNEVENVDFAQVMQDSVRTLRISEDGEYTFVGFKGDTPSFLEGKTQYTNEEIISVLDDVNGIWFISEAEENTWKDNARTVLSKLNPFNWF